MTRIGTQHQAGSDSLLTAATFFKMRKVFFEDKIEDEFYRSVPALPPSTNERFFACPDTLFLCFTQELLVRLRKRSRARGRDAGRRVIPRSERVGFLGHPSDERRSRQWCLDLDGTGKKGRWLAVFFLALLYNDSSLRNSRALDKS